MDQPVQLSALLQGDQHRVARAAILDPPQVGIGRLQHVPDHLQIARLQRIEDHDRRAGRARPIRQRAMGDRQIGIGPVRKGGPGGKHRRPADDPGVDRPAVIKGRIGAKRGAIADHVLPLHGRRHGRLEILQRQALILGAMALCDIDVVPALLAAIGGAEARIGQVRGLAPEGDDDDRGRPRPDPVQGDPIVAMRGQSFHHREIAP